MKRRILLIVVLAAALAAPSSTPAADATPPALLSKILRSFWLQSTPGKQGNKAYDKGDYEGALRHYAQADAENRAEGRPARQNERAALAFNTGNALYRQKRFTEATEAYQQALKGRGMKTARDSGFAARAHYNLGNAFYQKAAAADSTMTEQAIGDAREALAHYKKSLQVEPKNLDAKKNLERAQTLLQRLLKQQQQNQKKDPKEPEPSKRAQEALARALQLAQERRYPEAKAVLDDILRTDPTAAPYQVQAKRLDDVIKILKGQSPAPMAPGDPRTMQKGFGI